MRVEKLTTECQYVVTLNDEEFSDLKDLLERADTIGQAEMYRYSAMYSQAFESRSQQATPQPTTFGALATKVRMAFLMAGVR